MKKELIIKKIEKLMILSTSSNENEAQAAMLKAQKLMIKYKISNSDLNVEKKQNCNVRIYNNNMQQTT